MWSLLIVFVLIAYIATVTRLSYHLGLTKTDNAKRAALIGFIVSFLPPLALIYLVVLLFKEDVGVI